MTGASGITSGSLFDWIGPIPPSWRQVRNLGLFRERNERARPALDLLAVTIAHGVLPQSDYVEMTGRKLTATGDLSTYKVVRRGDLVYNKMRMWQGAVGVAAQDGIVSPAYVVLEPRPSVHPPFFGYLLKTPAFIAEAGRYSYGIADDQNSLRFEDFKAMYSLLPSLHEQRRIAAYLDQETRRIDELVHEQERLESLLREQRFSAMWHAVTKGGTSVPTSQATGREWLGDIPSGWRVTKLAHLVSCLDGKRAPLNAQARAERQGGVPYWGANGIVDHVDKAIFDELLVLVGEDGAPFFDRGTPVAFIVDEPIWPNNHIHVLRPRDRSREQAEWIAHVLNITDYTRFIDGATRDKLTQGSLMTIPVPVPPSDERDHLVQYLRVSLHDIDSMIEESRGMKELLLERRSALITAAVTGQIDVRDMSSTGGSATDSAGVASP